MPERLEFRLDDLDAPVEILIDTWGVPHIYAESRADLFVAQGFNAARARLFQMDLWRRRGLGLMAEAFGPQHVERDRAARLFLYRGDMRAEWLAYGSDTKAMTTAFVRGINAFVALCRRDPSFLPPEFEELGYLPGTWEATDIPRIRSHGLFHNLEQEVARAATLRDYGPAVEDLRRIRDPHAPVAIPEGLDLTVIPDDVLRVYRLATGPVDLSTPWTDPSGERTPEGSNNWVLGSSKTATGRPLLANDPHRAVTLPSLRYVAHLSAPGLDVIGGGEPVLPGVSIGHNGHLAFGLTIFAIDQEDLYVYRLNPSAPDEYAYRDRWEPMTTLTEDIPVRGSEPVTVELRFTRHGPVIWEDPDAGSAFAVRAAWLEPGMAPYLGSADYMTAADADEFRSAMNRWGAPGENQVYAEPGGTIGWRPGGLVPVRPNWDGLLPVPGDGRYEWAGFYDNDVLPSSHEPESDWVATANEMNLPKDFPADVTVGHDWYPAYRYERIAEELDGRDAWTVEDCLALQTDYVSLPARALQTLLARVDTDDERLRDAVQLLTDWDTREHADSAAAALYEVWLRKHLRPRLLETALSRHLPAAEVAGAAARLLPQEEYCGDPRVDLELLTRPVHHLGPDGERIAGEIMTDTLAAAVDDLTERFGADMASWSWGALHVAELVHPAHRVLPQDSPWTALGPVPRGGSGDTVGSTSFGSDFRQTAGASFRVVIDVGEWDNSLVVNSPGQSGDPRSPHYADHLETWAADGAFPLLYSRERVEEATTERIYLLPRS
ncbi:penicillin acylase family protein [Nocardioides aquiterrae]|uniref:Penicillin acylase family protein n=1 Tax=Nocardioides aquiterrae TaxID=203799 RepID=A0ABN1UMI1_9ACTN